MMKQGHLILIYVVIFIACFFMLFYAETKYDRVQKEKQKIEQALLEAVNCAGEEFSAVINASDEKKKQTLERSFFDALYVSMGIFDDVEKQENIRMYLPMLVLAEEDGAFFYHVQENNANGVTELVHTWSEKKMYPYSEESSKEEKKLIIAATLEQEASRIITRHNYIAKQYGISYLFSVPRFLQDTSAELQFPMLFVVFQGWPLTVTGDILYENCIDSAVYLQEVKQYVVTGMQNLSETQSYYHRKNCPYIVKDEIISGNSYLTEEDAIRRFGAFPCETCTK